MWTAGWRFLEQCYLTTSQPAGVTRLVALASNSVCKNFFPENQGEFGSLKQEPTCSFCMILAINLALLQILKFLFVWPHCALSYKGSYIIYYRYYVYYRYGRHILGYPCITLKRGCYIQQSLQLPPMVNPSSQ